MNKYYQPNETTIKEYPFRSKAALESQRPHIRMTWPKSERGMRSLEPNDWSLYELRPITYNGSAGNIAQYSMTLTKCGERATFFGFNAALEHFKETLHVARPSRTLNKDTKEHKTHISDYDIIFGDDKGEVYYITTVDVFSTSKTTGRVDKDIREWLLVADIPPWTETNCDFKEWYNVYYPGNTIMRDLEQSKDQEFRIAVALQDIPQTHLLKSDGEYGMWYEKLSPLDYVPKVELTVLSRSLATKRALSATQEDVATKVRYGAKFKNGDEKGLSSIPDFWNDAYWLPDTPELYFKVSFLNMQAMPNIYEMAKAEILKIKDEVIAFYDETLPSFYIVRDVNCGNTLLCEVYIPGHREITF